MGRSRPGAAGRFGDRALSARVADPGGNFQGRHRVLHVLMAADGRCSTGECLHAHVLVRDFGRFSRLSGAGGAFASFAVVVVAALCPGLSSCGGSAEKPLLPRSQTWAELRTVRRGVTVTPPGEAERAPYPRERLVDGEAVRCRAEGLAWLRRDGGATLLVRGPAKLTLRAEAIEVAEGRVFVDTPAGRADRADDAERAAPPRARAREHRRRAATGTTEAYVLAGEVARPTAPARAGVRASALPWSAAQRTAQARRKREAALRAHLGGLDRRPRDHRSRRRALAVRRRHRRRAPPGRAGRAALPARDPAPRRAGDHRGRLRDHRGRRDLLQPQLRDGRGRLPLPHARGRDAAPLRRRPRGRRRLGPREGEAGRGGAVPGQRLRRARPRIRRCSSGTRPASTARGSTRSAPARRAAWSCATPSGSGARGERASGASTSIRWPPRARRSSLPHIEELTAPHRARARRARRTCASGMAGVRDGDAWSSASTTSCRAPISRVELFDAGLDRAARLPRRARARSRGAAARASATRPRSARARRPTTCWCRCGRATSRCRAGGLDLAIVVDTSAATDAASLAIARAATGGAARAPRQGRSRRGVGGRRRAAADRARRTATSSRRSTRRRGAQILDAPRDRRRAAARPISAPCSARPRRSSIRRGAARSSTSATASPTVGELALARPARPPGEAAAAGARSSGSASATAPSMAILKGLARGAFAERIGDAQRGGARRAAPARAGRAAGVARRHGRSRRRRSSASFRATRRDRRRRERAGDRAAAARADRPTAMTHHRAGRRQEARRSRSTPLDDRGDLAPALGRGAARADDRRRRPAAPRWSTSASRHGIITPVTSLYVPTKNEMTAEERAELARRARRGRARTGDEGLSEPQRPVEERGGRGGRRDGERRQQGGRHRHARQGRRGLDGQPEHQALGQPLRRGGPRR